METDVSKWVLQVELWCFSQYLLLVLPHPIGLCQLPRGPMVTHLNVYYAFYSYNNPEQEQKQKAPKMQAAFSMSFKQVTPSELSRCLEFTCCSRKHLVSCRDKLYPCIFPAYCCGSPQRCYTRVRPTAFTIFCLHGQTEKLVQECSSNLAQTAKHKLLFPVSFPITIPQYRAAFLTRTSHLSTSCLFSYFPHIPSATQPKDH